MITLCVCLFLVLVEVRREKEAVVWCFCREIWKKFFPFSKEEVVGEGQYLVLLQPVPKRFVQMKNINAFVAKTRAAIDKNKCAY